VLYFVLRWFRFWRGRDVVITVLASLVMVGGMAALVHHGAWVLAPLLLGCALCWRTPLARNPFDLGPVEPNPHTPPWQRDARQRAAKTIRSRKP